MGKFKDLLRQSFKSADTEEWIDVHYTRPIGLVFALLWNRLGVHPNVVTLLSIALGVGSAFMFYHTDLTHNIWGVVLLMFANFCDSTDGQMARITGKKSLLGRILDGVASGLWFAAIYVALGLRMDGQYMLGTDHHWGVVIWGFVVISSSLCHSPQSSLADYYRQIHLYFLKGKDGSELDSSTKLWETYRQLRKDQWFERLYYAFYANYSASQERRTPAFQRFFSLWSKNANGIGLEKKETIRRRFLDGSRPLMRHANILSFNVRALCLYAACLLNQPILYFLFEIIVLTVIYVYMHHTHETLCKGLAETLETAPNETPTT